jgi:anti-anti-sigma factor
VTSDPSLHDSGDSDSEASEEASARAYLTVAVRQTDPARGLLVVVLKGELDIATLAICRHDFGAALNLLGEGRAKWMVLDVSECDFVDSTGLGVFVSLTRTARESGGDAIIAAPTSQIQRVFEVMNMTKFLTVADTMEQAKALIGTCHVGCMEESAED